MRSLKQSEEKKHLELLNLCFDQWGDEEKWRKFYKQPDFDPYENVLVVEENGEWIGGVTAWFRDVFLKQSAKVKVYIAGDAFVHPNHRGKGVYSTFMRSANELARRKRACLGFGFISTFETPFIALPKYGFVDIFYPKTKILALHPEKFLNYLANQVKEISFPKKFEGIKLKLIVSFNVLGEKQKITKIYQVKNNRLSEVYDMDEGRKNIDLSIKTDISTLLKIFRHFYLKRKKLFLITFAAFLTGRLRLRFSAHFIKMVLRS